MSVGPGGAQGDQGGWAAAISADGRFVAFSSSSDNLVAGAGSIYADIFVHDRSTGITSLISKGLGGTPANRESSDPALSADGRFVAFQSVATNLVPDDTNGRIDVFVHDVLTGTTQRVSTRTDGAQADADAVSSAISGDGRFVAFESRATTLVPGDTNARDDVFLHDRQTGITTRVSIGPGGVQADGHSTAAAISGDGRFIAFRSGATNLIAGDTNGRWDIFVHDRVTGVTERVSVGTGGVQLADEIYDPVAGGSQYFRPAISGDGRFVAFDSSSSTFFVAGRSQRDVFVHDRQSGTTERVNLTSGGLQANEGAAQVAIGADGNAVAFVSTATNLVAQPLASYTANVYVRDRAAGTTTLVSVGPGGVSGNKPSAVPRLTADGRLVAFASEAFNLVPDDTNWVSDVFVHDPAVAGPPPMQELTVSLLGTGDGVVSSAPAGIDCGPNCDYTYSYGTTVTLTATTAPGSVFEGWLGACSGVGPCVVHMTEPRNVTALFTSTLVVPTSRISIGPGGVTGNSNSRAPSLSADGRHVAFESHASNLVAGDTNGVADVFVHDRLTGATERVSVSTSGAQADGRCAAPSISADGRFVAFESLAATLVEGDTNGYRDIFVHDRQTGTTERVSVDTGGLEANEASWAPSISGDGQRVAFESYATNLVPDDTNARRDVFLHDRATHTTIRVSVAPDGAQGNNESIRPSISGDGRFVAFDSWADNLVADDVPYSYRDVFVRDLQTGQTDRVSRGVGGSEAYGSSYAASISASGRFVAFQSSAANLVLGDAYPGEDVFVVDRQTGVTTLVSVGPDGRPSNRPSDQASLSGDGRFVAFRSGASTLIDGDTNEATDVFVRDLVTGTTSRVSVGPGFSEAGGVSGEPSVSGDGRFVAFTSTSAALVLHGGSGYTEHVYVHDRAVTTTQPPQSLKVALAGTGSGSVTSDVPGIDCGTDCTHDFSYGVSVTLTPAPSAGGHGFTGWSGDCTGTGTCSVIMTHGRSVTATFAGPPPQGLPSLISTTPAGVPGNNGSYGPAASANGRFVAFESWAADLIAGDTNGAPDIFVHDRLTGRIERVSVGPGRLQSNAGSLAPAISADGRLVVFHSDASNLVTDDTNSVRDIFLHDRATHTTSRVSIALAGVNADGSSQQAGISADGRFVVFESEAGNLVAGDTNAATDAFVRDLELGVTTRVSVGDGGIEGDGYSRSASMTPDGQFVAFESIAGNLVPDDTNMSSDVFVRDLRDGLIARVSLGPGALQAHGHSGSPSISTDGRYVAFHSHATDLVEGDTNAASDVFVHDRVLGVTDRVSVDSAGNQGNQHSWWPALGLDGRWVAFQSSASNLAAGEVGTWDDVFLHDRVTGVTERVGAGNGGLPGNHGSGRPVLLAGGRMVAFSSMASNFATDDANASWDVFVVALTPEVREDLDSDGDGVSNLHEYFLGLDQTRTQLFFAEGALQGLFETRFSVFNPRPDPVEVGVRFQPQGGAEITDAFLLPGFGRRTFDTSEVQPGLVPAVGFATVFEAATFIVADRTMTWRVGSGPAHYASHAETALRRPSTQWYLAEGSLIGHFRLYYLLQNPMAVPAAVTIRYLFESAPPCLDSSIVVPPFSRYTVEVHVDVPAKCGLRNLDVSAEITSDTPLIVERAMYLQNPPRPFFYAGHAAQGVLAPQASWRFAEGATGPFFDTFVLVLNPDPEPTDVRLTFLRQNGTSRMVTRRVPGNSRRTYWLDVLTEQDGAGDFVVPREGGVSTLVDVVTPGKTVIAERAMWWPGPSTGAWSINPQPLWEEAHVSAGATTTATRWALAEAEAQGPAATRTYALVANTSPYEAKLRLTLHFTDEAGLVTSHVREICVAANSRTTWAFPWEADYGLGNCGAADDFFALFVDPATPKRFSVTIEALPHGGQPAAALVVERAQYAADQPAATGWVNPYTGRSYEGPYWPAGTNAPATPLQ
ncbi:MAG: PD40 domain-containing protein [Vicinamibacteraceae bacterium]|nr:PD40 domain-containing protein [Vicinamibacteraceae bacterium]